MKNAQVEAAPAIAVADAARPDVSRDYVALTKPRLNLLVVATSAAGYYLGSPSAPELAPMAQAVAGTALVAGGAAVLNQVYERDTDALMRRTRLRPLPDRPRRDRTMRARSASRSSVGGSRAAGVRARTCSPRSLALATLVIYLAVYTPLKRRSSIVDAGRRRARRAAAAHRLDGRARQRSTLGGWTLFAIVFLWQIPHFMAIAWMYRDDYRQAGFPMLPVIEPDGGAHGPAGGASTPRRSCRSAWCRRSSASAGVAYFWIALVLGVGVRSWLAVALRVDAIRGAGARALLRVDHLPAAHLDGDDPGSLSV